MQISVTVSKLCPRCVQPRVPYDPLVAVSEAHSIVGLAVYKRVGDNPVTMNTVFSVMAELEDHPEGCGCGCAWVRRADPVKVWRSASYWQRAAR